MNYTNICTMDAQGRIVIPVKIRRALSLADRDSLALKLTGQEICLRKCKNPSFGTSKVSRCHNP